MCVETDFYQLSGFRAHSNQWFRNERDFVNAIDSDTSKTLRPGEENSPIELVLGILPSGASYVLMTDQQMRSFTGRYQLRIPKDPWQASDFCSLSPIYFHSQEELEAKLKMYKQRPRNKNRREGEVPRDNSKANGAYLQAGTSVIHHRDYFEQQRILYHLMTRRVAPQKLGLSKFSWLDAARVISLVFVEWSIDNRPRQDRLNAPNLIEVGFSDALLPSFFSTLTSDRTLHLKVKKRVTVKNPHSREPHHSSVEELEEDALFERLRTLLSHDVSQSGTPLILLCHDEEMTRAILRRAGIDIKSFESGLNNLLPLAKSRTASAKWNRYSRSRSRSPHNDHDTRSHRRDYSSRSRVKQEEEPRLRPRSPVETHPAPYVVDVQKLAMTMMSVTSTTTVPETAKILRIQTDTRTCGGDDSLLQLRMWQSMSEGPAIDEQRALRFQSQPCTMLLSGSTPKTEDTSDDPNDLDPNDLDPNDLPALPPLVNHRFDDFSDDDY